MPPLSKKSTLLSLPEELLVQISEFVAHRTLLALRHTNTTFQRVSFDAFARAYFADRVQVISPWSLGILLLISTHERLGRYIKRLGFNSALLAHDEEDEGTDVRRDMIAEEQHIFVRSGGFGRLLTQVLRNLRRHGNSIEVLVLCNYYPVLGYGGKRLFSSEIEEPYWDSTIDTSMADTLMTYCKAAKTVDYPISKVILDLSMGDGDWASSVHNAAQALFSSRKDEDEYIPGGKLEIHLAHPHSPKAPGVLYWDCHEDILKLDNLNPVTGDILYSFRAFDNLTDWIPHQTIKHIAFNNCHTGASELSSLIDHHNTSLRSLHLEDVTLNDSSTWSFVLSPLADQCKLVSIYFEGLWSIEGTMMCDCGIDDEVFEAKGVHNLNRMVKMLTARFLQIEAEAREEYEDSDGSISIAGESGDDRDCG